jgi:hypothetical protein
MHELSLTLAEDEEVAGLEVPNRLGTLEGHVSVIPVFEAPHQSPSEPASRKRRDCLR